MAKDTCVMCGVETPYNYETHIDFRDGYVEGVGQLCKKCFERDNTETISIPLSFIKNTPNDMELGEKVRIMSYRS